MKMFDQKRMYHWYIVVSLWLRYFNEFQVQLVPFTVRETNSDAGTLVDVVIKAENSCC